MELECQQAEIEETTSLLIRASKCVCVYDRQTELDSQINLFRYIGDPISKTLERILYTILV